VSGPSTSEQQRPIWGRGTSFDDEEARDFHADRVALYARLVTLFFVLVFLGGGLVVALVVPDQFVAIHEHPAKIANVVAVAVSAGIWWAVRRPKRSAVMLIAGDALLPLLINLGSALVAPYVPRGFGITFVPMLVSALALLFRAAFVPSPPQRTVWIGALASVPMIWAQYQMATISAPLPGFATPALVALATTGWSAAVVVGTALVSQEIYGLRTQVAKAQRLGQYTIERLVGEGGMGSVYVARHARLRRPTALKLLSPERSSPEAIARFEREVQLTSQLTHPNTVAVYDYGRSPDGVFYYAMEYIDGVSLAQLVDEHGPQPAGRVIHILRQAADALVEAHALGLIHRDVKPANIILCERPGNADVVKLLDFGLVKDIRPNDDPALTRADAITGTPLYLAPEAITDPAAVDHRVDLYALGAVGYCLLTGVPPFQGRSTVEVCSQHLHTAPLPPSERLGKPVPAELEAVLLACLAKKREERPESARELCRRLAECAARTAWSEDDARAFWGSRRKARVSAGLQVTAPPPLTAASPVAGAGRS
jgi:eukaryotic-like serine/threonine-protein kinase